VIAECVELNIIENIMPISILWKRKTMVEQPDNDVNKVNWLANATQFLGIPALIVVMLMNWGSFGESNSSATKNIAETSQIEVETNLKRIELQEKLEELTNKKIDDFSKYKSEVLPVIESTSRLLDKFNQINNALWAGVLLKSIIIAFLLTIFHFFGSVVNQFWGTFFGIMYAAFFGFVLDKMDYAKTKKVRKFTIIIFPLISVMPSVLIYSVEFFLIFTFSYRLALEAASIAGFGDQFRASMDLLLNFEFGQAFDTLLRAMFG
jgi:hypothetical protein